MEVDQIDLSSDEEVMEIEENKATKGFFMSAAPTTKGSLQPTRKRRGIFSSQHSIPWVEKYRPKTITDVVYQEEVVSVLKKCLERGGADFPNLLFYGPPGTGKTSTILAIARDMYTPEFMKERVLELNASDERGIDVVREKVKTFSSGRALSKLPNGKSCPPFKLVILDEADSMTHAAQTALRRVVESYTTSTRFCLICNYMNKMIDPISSRCSKFRFKPLKDDLIFNKLSSISATEGIKFESDDVLNELIKICDGDLRKAITFLQTLFRVKCRVVSGDDDSQDKKEALVTLKDVHELSGYIPKEFIRRIMASCKTKKMERIEKSVDGLLLEGYSAGQFLIQLKDYILSDPTGKKELRDTQKAKILIKLATVDHYLQEGGSEYLQMMDLASEISEIMAIPESEDMKRIQEKKKSVKIT